MKINKIKSYLYHISFESQFEMCSTMLRFQEHYESPKFKNKVFTLKEFKKYYSKYFGNGKFTYFSDWSGFNFPSKILKPFYAGKFDPLSKKEKSVLKYFKDIKGKFYIIGTFDSYKFIEETMKHEIAHAMFKFNKSYKKDVLDAIETVDASDLENLLKNKWGYHKSVISDEVHAFILTNDEMLEENGIDFKKYEKTQEKLNEIFLKYDSEEK